MDSDSLSSLSIAPSRYPLISCRVNLRSKTLEIVVTYAMTFRYLLTPSRPLVAPMLFELYLRLYLHWQVPKIEAMRVSYDYQMLCIFSHEQYLGSFQMNELAIDWRCSFYKFQLSYHKNLSIVIRFPLVCDAHIRPTLVVAGVASEGSRLVPVMHNSSVLEG